VVVVQRLVKRLYIGLVDILRPVQCVLVSRCQLDESCIQHHVNERRVRTLDEEEEAGSSVTEVDTASADNNDLEYDLEELAGVENSGEGLDEDENNSSDNVDDTGSNDDDDYDDDTQLKSEDIVSSDTSRAVMGTTENDIKSSLQGCVVDISVDAVSSAVPGNNAGVSEDTSSAVAQISRVDGAADKDSTAVAGVDVEKHEPRTESQSEKMSTAADEFPDTSIDLRHVSGSTYVDLLCSFCSTLCYSLLVCITLTLIVPKSNKWSK